MVILFPTDVNVDTIAITLFNNNLLETPQLERLYEYQCYYNDYKEHTYECNNGTSRIVSCRGEYEIITAKCPQYHPYNSCDRYDVDSGFVNDNCIIMQTDDYITTCSCVLSNTNRRYLTEKTQTPVFYGSKMTYKYDIYDHNFDDVNFNFDSNARPNSIGFATIFSFTVLVLIVIISSHVFDTKKMNKVTDDTKNNNITVDTIKRSLKGLRKQTFAPDSNDVNNIIFMKTLDLIQSVESEIPHVFRGASSSQNNATATIMTSTWESLFKIIKLESINHNIYFSIFSTPPSKGLVPLPLPTTFQSSKLLFIQSFISSLVSNQRIYLLFGLYIKFLLVMTTQGLIIVIL